MLGSVWCAGANLGCCAPDLQLCRPPAEVSWMRFTFSALRAWAVSVSPPSVPSGCRMQPQSKYIHILPHYINGLF